MTAPSQMSLRRIPDALRLPVRIAYSAGWEALIDAHKDQLLQFVCEFAPRVPALDRESLSSLIQLPPLVGWHRFRLDLILERLRYRRRYHDKTLELAHMVGARAAEAVVATHVENAIGLIRLLKGVMPVNAAADHYLREFNLPASIAQMVMQRVQARVAGEELTAQYDDRPPALPEPAPPRLDSSSDPTSAFSESVARTF